MAAIAVIPVVWDGLPGLPGVSVHYSIGTDAVAAVAALNTYFTSIRSLFPTGLTFQTPTGGDIVDETTGGLLSDYTGATSATVIANGGNVAYAAGVGARVRWRTPGIENGRRVIGSSFLVPLVGGAYDTSGTILTESLGTMQAAANALVSSDLLRIWHRPSPGASNGQSYPISSAQALDKVATLRSRRT